MAQLSSTRARLLWELLGIPGETLVSFPIIGDWTVKDLLVHLADYDRLYGNRVSLALSGTTTDERIDFPKVGSNPPRDHDQELTFDAAVEALMNARSGFRTAFQKASEKDLDRLYRTGKSRGSIRSWIGWCLRHDAGHLRDIRKWRRSLGQRRNTGPKSILLAAMKVAREDLLDSIILVSQEGWDKKPVTGEWTLNDVVGHIAGWNTYFINWLHSMTGKPILDLYYEDDEETFNNYLYRLRKDQPLKDTWYDFQASHQSLSGELQALSQEDLERRGASSLIDFEDIYHLAWSALEHDLHHAALLRAGIETQLPKWLLKFEGLYT